MAVQHSSACTRRALDLDVHLSLQPECKESFQRWGVAELIVVAGDTANIRRPFGFA